MPKSLSEVTRDAAELPEIERIKLARILLDMSETEPTSENDTEQAWEREIERRLRELESGAVKGVSLEETKRRIEATFKR